jgi:hypothetical protein
MRGVTCSGAGREQGALRNGAPLRVGGTAGFAWADPAKLAGADYRNHQMVDILRIDGQSTVQTACAEALSDASAIRPERGIGRAVWSPRSSASGRALHPVGFIVSNLRRPAERVVVFHNQRGTAEDQGGQERDQTSATFCRQFRHTGMVEGAVCLDGGESDRISLPKTRCPPYRSRSQP